MRFNSGREMLDYIMDVGDLYNSDSEQYVFLYNNYGAIAVYRLNVDEFRELYRRAEEDGEYVSAYLGFDGYIYDSEDNPNPYDRNETYSSLDWCNDHYLGYWENA